MDADWISVQQAASRLGTKPREVRRLVSSGTLVGERVHGVWFLDPASVRARVVNEPKRGRGLSALNARRLLALIDAAAAGVPEPARELDAVARHRMRNLLAHNGPDQLARLLSARAQRMRHRVHPGVLERVRADERVRVGGSEAAVEHGAGLMAGGRQLLYVAAADLPDLQRDYGLRPDPAGDVELMVVDAPAAKGLLPAQGRFVSPATAWADLLEDEDPRARHAALEWFAAALEPAAHAVRRRT